MLNISFCIDFIETNVYLFILLDLFYYIAILSDFDIGNVIYYDPASLTTSAMPFDPTLPFGMTSLLDMPRISLTRSGIYSATYYWVI